MVDEGTKWVAMVRAVLLAFGMDRQYAGHPSVSSIYYRAPSCPRETRRARCAGRHDAAQPPPLADPSRVNNSVDKSRRHQAPYRGRMRPPRGRLRRQR